MNLSVFFLQYQLQNSAATHCRPNPVRTRPLELPAMPKGEQAEVRGSKQMGRRIPALSDSTCLRKVEACACNAEPAILADILTSLGSRLPALLGRDSSRKTSIPYATAPADGSADMLPSARLDYASARVVCPVENEKSSSSVVRPSSPHISYVYVIMPIGSAPSAAAFLELAPSEYPLRSHHNCIEGYYGRRRTRDIYPSTPIGTAA